MTIPVNVYRGRTDAVQNRAHILSVAEERFADSGVEAETPHRHFPTRESFVVAVLKERYLELEESQP